MIIEFHETHHEFYSNEYKKYFWHVRQIVDMIVKMYLLKRIMQMTLPESHQSFIYNPEHLTFDYFFASGRRYQTSPRMLCNIGSRDIQLRGFLLGIYCRILFY